MKRGVSTLVSTSRAPSQVARSSKWDDPSCSLFQGEMKSAATFDLTERLNWVNAEAAAWGVLRVIHASNWTSAEQVRIRTALS